MDMGAEARSLYTADVTRVLPATRTFAGPQREVYDVVLAAQDAAIAVVRAGVPYAEIARASDRVLADGLAQLGVLPCSADVALESTSQVFRRWTMHGTGHMLGLDVHDCSRGQIEDYSGGILETGMVLTIEPGLYFQPDDAIAPPELRGIGIRIEDDFVVEGDGCDNLSAHFRERQRQSRSGWRTSREGRLPSQRCGVARRSPRRSACSSSRHIGRRRRVGRPRPRSPWRRWPR